jgi:hypothetical protein
VKRFGWRSYVYVWFNRNHLLNGGSGRGVAGSRGRGVAGSRGRGVAGSRGRERFCEKTDPPIFLPRVFNPGAGDLAALITENGMSVYEAGSRPSSEARSSGLRC